MAEKLVEISVDRTMLIQAGNFLVLMLALHYLLFKPVRRFMEERRAQIDGPKVEAARLDGEAERKLRHYEEGIAAARREAAERTSAARAQAERQSQERIARARDQALSEVRLAVHRMEQEAQAIGSTLREDALRLSRVIAEKVLGRPV